MINMGTGGKLRGKALWAQMVKDQEQWIAEHGGDLQGYIDDYRRRGYGMENATIVYESHAAALRKFKRLLDDSR